MKLTRVNSTLRWITISGLLGNTAWWCWKLIEGSGSPRALDPYQLQGAEPPADWMYPTAGVAEWIAVYGVEVLVLAVLLRIVKGSTAGLCLFLSILTAVGALFFSMAMHVSLPYGIHARTLFGGAGWLLVMAVISGIVVLVARDRAAEALVSTEPPPARVVRR